MFFRMCQNKNSIQKSIFEKIEIQKIFFHLQQNNEKHAKPLNFTIMFIIFNTFHNFLKKIRCWRIPCPCSHTRWWYHGHHGSNLIFQKNENEMEKEWWKAKMMYFVCKNEGRSVKILIFLRNENFDFWLVCKWWNFLKIHFRKKFKKWKT